MSNSTFPRLLSSLAGVLVVGLTATCVEQPTDPPEAAGAPARGAPSAAEMAEAGATSIVHTRLTSGNSASQGMFSRSNASASGPLAAATTP